MMIVTPWDTTIRPRTIRLRTTTRKGIPTLKGWGLTRKIDNPENPIICVKSSCHPLGLKILIQTITKIPERVKTSAEYGLNGSLANFV